MSVGGFLHGLVENDAMGEQMITSVQDLYEKTRNLSPANDPHLNLAKAYFSRINSRDVETLRMRPIDISDPRSAELVFSQTLVFSCLPEGDNVRALALKIIVDERPNIWRKYPKFEEDYLRLGRLFDDLNNGSTLFELYERRNPKLQIKISHPVMYEALRSGRFDDFIDGKFEEAAQLEANRPNAEQLETSEREAERLRGWHMEAAQLEENEREAKRLSLQERQAAQLEASEQEVERLRGLRMEAMRQEAEQLRKERLGIECRAQEGLELRRREAERLGAEVSTTADHSTIAIPTRWTQENDYRHEMAQQKKLIKEKISIFKGVSLFQSLMFSLAIFMIYMFFLF